jgi:hypothetical protein
MSDTVTDPAARYVDPPRRSERLFGRSSDIRRAVSAQRQMGAQPIT